MEEEIKLLRTILKVIAHRSSDEMNTDYDELINNMNKIQELTEPFKEK